jgi:ribonuclease HII
MERTLHGLPLCSSEDDIEVGVDEVGRGCLMGPVFTSAVILPKEIDMSAFDHLPKIPRQKTRVPVIRDSKKLSERQRSIAQDFIKEFSIDYSVTSIDTRIIDEINILNATIRCMHKSLDEIRTPFSLILVDGNRFKPYMTPGGDFIPNTCLVEGDAHVASIACASILAKTARDSWVQDLCARDPDTAGKYGWLSNKGYGTADHLAGLREYGVTEYHRRSFAPCK